MKKLSKVVKKKEEKTCFIICPIGKDNSPERKRANDLLDFIISPCLKEFGYMPIRADLISKSGMITSQIIRHVIESDLAIADLYKYNPNVFYELAIRHVTRKPYIQLMSKDQILPFDIADVRTIMFDIEDLRSVEKAKKYLKKHIESIVKDKSSEVETPISRVIDLKTLLESKDPQKQDFANLMEMIYSINSQLKDIQNNISSEKRVYEGSRMTLSGVDTPVSQVLQDYILGKTQLCSNCGLFVTRTADGNCPKCRSMIK